jgi:serine/threonine-protein kinase
MASNEKESAARVELSAQPSAVARTIGVRGGSAGSPSGLTPSSARPPPLPSADSSDNPNEKIGRYAIERLLARGGMAEVYVGKALGPAGFSKRVVIKRILPDLAQKTSFESMFLSEARLAALLEHPNIVQVFDFGRDANTYFLAMEYIEGESLRNILKYHAANQRSVPLGPIIAWTLQVCEGLGYAHELKDENGRNRGIVHRDISPENILIASTGTAKVLDFGVAKTAEPQHQATGIGEVKGKFAYIAPEQIRGEQVDRRADVYSLGVTLYEAFAGRRPHRAANQLQLLYSIINTDAPTLHDVRPEIDSVLSNVVSRAIARDPKQRYPDMQALYSALDDYLNIRRLRVKTTELSELVARVAQWDAQKITELPSTEFALWSSPARSTPSPPGKMMRNDRDLTSEAPVSPSPAPPAARSPPIEWPGVEVDSDPPHGRHRRRLLGLGALAFVGLAVLVILAVAAKRSSKHDLATSPARSSGATPSPLAAPQGSTAASPIAQPTSAVAAPGPAANPPPPDAPPAPTTVPPVSRRTPPPAAMPPRRAPQPSARPTLRADPAKQHPPMSPEPVAAAAIPALEALPQPPSLPPLPDDGWLNLRTEPWCEVYFRGELIGTTPLNHLVFPAGRHSLLLVNKVAGVERKIEVEIRPSHESTTRLRLTSE